MSSPPTSQSLLQRARDRGDAASWRRLTDLYTPLVRRWVRRAGVGETDLDDVVQEVLTALVRDLPRFEHNRRAGAFRAWLRTITVHRVRTHWQARPPAIAGSPEALAELEDPESPLSRAWDEEHDRHVLGSLLESIRLEFQPATWRAFERQVRDGVSPAEVAGEVGLSVNAVLVAKSRVLKRLRQKAAGLVD